jgi:alkaline phosphatase
MRWVLVCAVLLVACTPPNDVPPPDAAPTPAEAGPRRAHPRVVLMIGDGMGRAQLDAASLYAHGATGQLFLQSLPVHGRLRTASLSGTTDSAAAATAMATGVLTLNGRLAVDRHDAPATTLVELAHGLGRAAGVVTTASLPHATPGAFTAHQGARGDYLDIARDQVLRVRPEVMLGGGAQYFTEAGLEAALDAAGYTLVRDASELAAAAPPAGRLVGLFAEHHMTYVLDRTPDSREPELATMALRALDVLDADADGFFLMIEGGRIDMAAHVGDLPRTVSETLAFDDAVAAVAAWAATHDDVTLVVTADHETGGLAIVAPAPAGSYPQVSWRWGQHTSTDVDVFASGPGSEAFAGVTRDHTWVHAVLAGALAGTPVVAPARRLVADGVLEDLRWSAAHQAVATGFGAGHGQLDELRLDGDADVLALGVAGVLEWEHNALVVLVDLDYGAGTAAGTLVDRQGDADAILAALQVRAPDLPGFGADVAFVVHGGSDPRLEDRRDDAGVRALRPPRGRPDDLGWYGAATNFADGTRARAGSPVAAVPARGWELHVPWTTLYPEGRPPGATLALAAILVNDDGGYTSNQALPPFPPGTANPGRTPVSLPGVVVFAADATSAPRVVPVLTPPPAPHPRSATPGG